MLKTDKKVLLTRDTLSLEALVETGDYSLASESEQHHANSMENEVFRSLFMKEIYAGLAILPEAQRKVLCMIFGLAGQDKLSTQEIAWQFGQNSAWVMLTARKALHRLRSECGSRLEGYLGIAA
jgi:DNA-directed RNA polymerase sigma subunit (sigma70/sigma32)